MKVGPGEEEVGAPRAVSFDAYLSRGRTTRAGEPGELTTSTGTYNLQGVGFGVFGYHTQAVLYGPYLPPNFMFNTHVTYDAGAWTYAPLKYWPNQTGADAASTSVDRLSLFAYAPWVAVDPETGELADPEDGTPAKSHTNGITRLIHAQMTGDPLVAYKGSFVSTECVDLCWGVGSDGSQFADLVKPPVEQKVTFHFQHALSSLNIQVDAPVDAVTPPGGSIASDTRIYLRSIAFEGFATKGTLNLNSSATTGPLWLNYYADGPIPHDPVTLYDGRRDGREALEADSGESPTGVNPVLIQKDGYNTQPGVTGSAVNLFDHTSAETDPIYVIPNNYPLKVTIVYDVETRDDRLVSSYLSDGTTHGRVTRVSVSRTIATSEGVIRLEAGKRYILQVHLGMTSVKFDVGVTTDWTPGLNPVRMNPVLVTGQEVEDFETNTPWVITFPSGS